LFRRIAIVHLLERVAAVAGVVFEKVRDRLDLFRELPVFERHLVRARLQGHEGGGALNAFGVLVQLPTDAVRPNVVVQDQDERHFGFSHWAARECASSWAEQSADRHRGVKRSAGTTNGPAGCFPPGRSCRPLILGLDFSARRLGSWP
jgi:hypothetical protein